MLNFIKMFFSLLLIVGLAFSSGLFAVLLYSKWTGKEQPLFAGKSLSPDDSAPFIESPLAPQQPNKEQLPQPVAKKLSARLEAPLVKQNPELPSGCEITALAMLFQYYGIQKDKMDLVPEMKKDPTPIKWGKNGKIEYWGNPNIGYVGDITGKQKGFGIYHAALFELLKKYIPTGIDLTGSSFDELEQKIAQGIPVVVWTTISFTVPKEAQWVVWDSPLGPIRTTFQEHSVLLVGYDEKYVYVNDPLSGKKNLKIEKQQFIATWESLSKQAITYEAM